MFASIKQEDKAKAVVDFYNNFNQDHQKLLKIPFHSSNPSPLDFVTLLSQVFSSVMYKTELICSNKVQIFSKGLIFTEHQIDILLIT